ncbi:putative membrane protein [Eubacterium multiforme]|uniref:Membrane protein n=1 Tax=Eubacterium multiforme TaxID=83339 RepID=A0ABT9UT45_9FIRM|nr:putative membrane protein [Eubacterium multiforme]
MSVKNFMNNIMKNKYLITSITITIVIIAAILIVTFTPFKQIPFVYNEF